MAIDSKPKGFKKVYTVQASETLTSIAKKVYGEDSAFTYMDIYEANKELIGPDPDLIKVGMVLEIPQEK